MVVHRSNRVWAVREVARCAGGSLAALTLVAALAACGTDSNNSAVSVGAGDNCKAPALCDITQPACERAVLELTACVRGDSPGTPPPLRVITQSQFRAQLQAEAQKQNPQPSPWDTALQALHLEPSGTGSLAASIDESVNSVAAYYSDVTKDITVIESSTTSDPLAQMYVLSHELTHYLQDKTRGLSGWGKHFDTSTDGSVAFVALVEGEAVATSTRALAALHGRSPDSFQWGAYFDDLQARVLSDIATSSTPLYVARQSLPYPVGGRYVADAWNGYDRQHVDKLLDAPPVHLSDLIAGYGPGKVAPSLVQPLDCGPPTAPAGFTLFSLDSFGVTGAAALLLANDPNGPNASPGVLFEDASRLVNDAIAVYATVKDKTNPVTPVLVAWRMRFESASALDAFVNDLSAGLDPQVQLTTSGTELLITASDVPGSPLTGKKLTECSALKDLTPATPPSGSMADVRL